VTRIQIIGQNHPLYSQEVDLRQRVLLDPIGFTMEKFAKEFPGVEERFEHFIAVIEHPKGKRVVGTVCLLPNYPEKGAGKLMQMAVDPQRQREGIGRELVVELERRAFGELGLQFLFCHAREDAVGFYSEIGWQVVGDPFMEAGIKHFRMELRGESGDSSA